MFMKDTGLLAFSLIMSLSGFSTKVMLASKYDLVGVLFFNIFSKRLSKMNR